MTDDTIITNLRRKKNITVQKTSKLRHIHSGDLVKETCKMSLKLNTQQPNTRVSVIEHYHNNWNDK